MVTLATASFIFLVDRIFFVYVSVGTSFPKSAIIFPFILLAFFRMSLFTGTVALTVFTYLINVFISALFSILAEACFVILADAAHLTRHFVSVSEIHLCSEKIPHTGAKTSKGLAPDSSPKY